MQEWPKFLQFQDPQWHLVLRTLTTTEGPVRTVDVVTLSGDVCYFPDRGFVELEGLKIGALLSKAKVELADRLWEKIQDPKMTNKERDDLVGAYCRAMEDLKLRRDQFMRKYGITSPAALYLKARIDKLKRQLKGSSGKTREAIKNRITEINDLFVVPDLPASSDGKVGEMLLEQQRLMDAYEAVQRPRHCTEHALAYVFQCGLEEVPDFDPALDAEAWSVLKADFARARGKIPLSVSAPVQKWPPILMDLPVHILDVMAGYPMVFGGLNAAGEPHCVVVQGLGVYDPNPSKKELDTWNDIQVFIPIEDVRKRWGDEIAALPSLEIEWVEVSDAKQDPDFPALVAEGQELRREFDKQTRGMRG